MTRYLCVARFATKSQLVAYHHAVPADAYRVTSRAAPGERPYAALVLAGDDVGGAKYDERELVADPQSLPDYAFNENGNLVDFDDAVTSEGTLGFTPAQRDHARRTIDGMLAIVPLLDKASGVHDEADTRLSGLRRGSRFVELAVLQLRNSL